MTYNYIMSKIKGFKTIMFTIIVSVFALLEMTDLTGVLSEDKMPYMVIGIGIINIVLRAVSTTNIGKNE